ncbi:ABC transporter ATP-binding protein [Anaerosporobacter sp.]|uniref:ABC transporter ATP-binding protein n=1 Tax=Anaerosporobacter sp. TaxID=1872529 RepID=UPI00286F750D|nr:ABC transporter ATP-binding protein [Anaerosporobacter sp.]
MNIVKVEHLTKQYGSQQAVSDVNFTIDKGEIVGYLGPNGSGKTTTINIITGLVTPDKGKVDVLGCDVAKEYSKLLSRIGVVLDVNGLYERLTAKQNLEFFLNACGKSIDMKELDNMMELLQLKNDIDKKVKCFSKGMKRKLALARVLLVKPEMVFLDEPFDGIDIEVREEIIQLIRYYQEEYSTSFMLTSHVMADIEELATRIIVIREGKIIIDEGIMTFKEREGDSLTNKYLKVVKK